MSVSTSTNNSGGYPPSAATFAAGLGATNFDLAAYVPVGCLFPAATFHDKLVFSTLAPLAIIAVLWVPSIKERIVGTRSVNAENTAGRWSLFLLELVVSSVSTTIVQTFWCFVVS
jgi:hypothetical protein